MKRLIALMVIALLIALASLSSLSAPALADTGDDIIIMTPEPGLSAALFADWTNHVMTIYVGYPLPGCLRLIGGGRLDAELPDSCGVSTYTIGPSYLSDNYRPQGRTLVLRTYDGIDRAFYQLPPDPGYRYLPLVVGP